LARFVRGDVVVIEHVGSDGNVKRRPAVVLTSWEWFDNGGGSHHDYWISIISTQVRDNWSVELDPCDITGGTLHRLPCRVRCTNMLVAAEWQLLRKVCNLTPTKIAEVLTVTQSLLV